MDLTDIELDKMFKIIISNLYKIFDDFKEKEGDRERWTNSLKTSDINIILIYDTDLIAYIEYIDKKDYYILSEIQIDDEHKGDGKTFRTLLTEFYNAIKPSSIIKCHINDKNKKSFNTFNNIGLKKIDKELYELSYDGLEKYVKGNELLMSIKTRYANKIFNGTKTYEYRRKSIGNKNCNKKIYIYSSEEDKMIVGYIIVDKILKGDLDYIEKSTGNLNTDSRRKYFEGCDICYALHISEYHKLKKAISLNDVKFVVPQFYRYIKEDEPLYKILKDRV